MAVAAIGVLATLSVLGGATDATAAPSTTIEWAASPLPESGADALPVLVQDFERAYPSIRVSLVAGRSQSELETEIASGASSPDVFSGDVTWAATLGAGGYAAALTGHLPPSFFTGFAPSLLADTEYRGQAFAAPFAGDQGLLYYRKDLLAKDHLGVPVTWQQLESDSKVMQRARQVAYGFVWEGARYEGLTDEFLEYLTDAGGSVLDARGTASDLDSTEAKTALSFMRSLITSGVSPRAVTAYEQPQALVEFEAGNAAFLRTWSYAWPILQSNGSRVTGDVGVAPLPAFQGTSSPGYSAVGGVDLYVNPHSHHLVADLTLLRWLVDPTAQRLMATRFGIIPVNAAVRAEPAVLSADPVLATMQRARLVAPPAETAKYAAVSEAIFANVNGALTGSNSPAAALRAASSAIDKTLTTSK